HLAPLLRLLAIEDDDRQDGQVAAILAELLADVFNDLVDPVQQLALTALGRLDRLLTDLAGFHDDRRKRHPAAASVAPADSLGGRGAAARGAVPLEGLLDRGLPLRDLPLGGLLERSLPLRDLPLGSLLQRGLPLSRLLQRDLQPGDLPLG